MLLDITRKNICFSFFLFFHCMNVSIKQKLFCFFSHGLADTKAQAYRYIPDFIPFPVHTFNYNDARSFFRKIPKIKEVSLAQENEILCFVQEFETFELFLQMSYGDEYQIVLYGVSRGASVVLMFLALYPEKLSHVCAVIIESPFDSIDSIIEYKIKNIPFLSLKQGQLLLKKIFWKYNHIYAAPKDIVHAIPNNIPLLIAYTQNDILVPPESTHFLYDACIKNGNSNTTLFVATEAEHAQIIHHPKDKILFKNAIDSFLKMHA